MAISSRGNALLFRLRARLAAQRYNHTVADSGLGAQFRADVGPGSVLVQGRISRRKLDSRAFGITRSMISSPSWTVLKVLRGAGFEAYLVGGCVRDLILNRVPKDFDVITTAKLKQIKKEFRRCTIVGQRFPICMVHVKGSVVEVSSFETVAKHGEEKEIVLPSDIPHGCDRKDFVLWKNCMQRDFTINSLFFDPFINSIYDYVNGIVDVKCLKLRTLIPAEASFQEDCARILRGVRIAARLGLSFSEDTENAIHKLSLSIATLTKSRLLLELNYMLSYGAAEPSFHLLQRFNLLEILLPFHAAYLAEQAREQSSQNPAMLMKLFFNLDKLVTCDQPAESTLWVALLAFHLALVINSQDALVVWTFASVLYHQSWKLGVKFARKHAQTEANFIPEISEAHESISDAELAERATHLAAAAQYSINALTDRDSLLQLMSRFPDLTCSGLVANSASLCHVDMYCSL
ncbi:Polynucleotide adenylyltransferase [Bertholletia excelsa]